MSDRPRRGIHDCLHPLCILCLLLLWPVLVTASPQERGLAIARAADAYDAGFGDYIADMVMVLADRGGRSSRRDLRIRVLETKGDGDKLLFIFDSPPDVRGTLMLTHSHGARADDQWLYLPSLKRVKRIASSNKSGPFMGSEFAYEDLASQEVDKYRYRHLREEPCGAWHCDVLERIPRSGDSGYKRQLVWIDQDGYRVVKVEYYDRRDELLKTLALSGYREYLGHYWRPARMDMVNHRTGKRTRLEWSGYRFRTGLKARDFQPGTLQRVR